MGAVVKFKKNWRSNLHQQKKQPATVVVLPMEKEIVFEIDKALEARLNGDSGCDAQRWSERQVPDARKMRRSVRRSVRQADESTAAIDEVLQRK